MQNDAMEATHALKKRASRGYVVDFDLYIDTPQQNDDLCDRNWEESFTCVFKCLDGVDCHRL